MKWNVYYTALMCLVIGAGLKSCLLEQECKQDGKIQFSSSKIYECKKV